MVAATRCARVASRTPTASSPARWFLLVNKLDRSSRVDVAVLERRIDFADGRVLVPNRRAGADALVGSRFSWSQAPSGWQIAFRELGGPVGCGLDTTGAGPVGSSCAWRVCHRCVPIQQRPCAEPGEHRARRPEPEYVSRMVLTTSTTGAVIQPEMIAVLGWWGVILASPLVFVRRWRRRRAQVLRRSPLEQQPGGAPAPSPADGFTSLAASERRQDRRPGETTTRIPHSRLSAATLDPLCRYIDFRRRLELALSELEAKLSRLPRERWRIEAYPLTGARGNSLLVLGETGVFVISATYAPGHWDDVIAANRLAGKIQLLLPGYPGNVRPAICHPSTATSPRLWHRPDDHGRWIGCWVIGGDRVVDWIEHFGRQHGLSIGDLKRFDELAKPNWLRPARPTAASWPAISSR